MNIRRIEDLSRAAVTYALAVLIVGISAFAMAAAYWVFKNATDTPQTPKPAETTHTTEERLAPADWSDPGDNPEYCRHAPDSHWCQK